MEVAKLILEFLKVLTWPIVTLLIVWQFKPYLERILGQFSDRLKTAETLKLGVMGQEVQISGTAKELLKERELLTQSGFLSSSTEKVLAIENATRELNNPMADVVGMALLSAQEALTIEELTRRILKTMNPKESPTTEHAPFMLVMLSKQIEKMLASLQSLDYVELTGETYSLSSAGRDFFQRVQERYGEFLARFNALASR
jgi:hypothetical protein